MCYLDQFLKKIGYDNLQQTCHFLYVDRRVVANINRSVNPYVLYMYRPNAIFGGYEFTYIRIPDSLNGLCGHFQDYCRPNGAAQ